MVSIGEGFDNDDWVTITVTHTEMTALTDGLAAIASLPAGSPTGDVARKVLRVWRFFNAEAQGGSAGGGGS